MAFALTAFKAFGIQTDGPGRKWARQQVLLYITAAATDVDLDIGDAAGTFWTAAQANATYGSLATAALADLENVVGQCNGLLSVQSPQLVDRVQVASLTTTGQYTVTADTYGVDLAFTAADGETAWIVALSFDLKDNKEAVFSDRGTAQ